MLVSGEHCIYDSASLARLSPIAAILNPIPKGSGGKRSSRGGGDSNTMNPL